MNKLPISRTSLAGAATLIVFCAALVGLFGPGGGHGLAIKEVSLDEAQALIRAGALVIDVRDRASSISAHLPGALLIPLEVLSVHLKTIEVYRYKPVVIYCASGVSRGPQATKLLNQAGFGQAVNLKSGIEGWRDAGLPIQRG